MSDWQTIESAPKDGTEFLACYAHQGNVMALIRYDRVHRCWLNKGDVVHGFEANATHWQRLPSKEVRT